MKEYRALEFDKFLLRARDQFLLGEKGDFRFEIRRRSNIPNFYQLLEEELSAQDIFSIESFKRVREGHVWMPRPAALLLKREKLLKRIPEILSQREQLEIVLEQEWPIQADIFLETHLALLKKDPAQWLPAMEIFRYILQNSANIKGLLPRQIPHGQSTKIIGKDSVLLALYRFHGENPSASWQDFFSEFGLVEKNLEFRFYAPQCFYQGNELSNFHGIISKETCESWKFKLEGSLVIENYETFLAMSRTTKRHLLLWGEGWKVIQMSAFWKYLSAPVSYWGDLDKEGLEILQRLALENEVIPILMDLKTLEKYRYLAQRVGAEKKADLQGSEVYRKVCEEGLRIEQEQIPWEKEFPAAF